MRVLRRARAASRKKSCFLLYFFVRGAIIYITKRFSPLKEQSDKVNSDIKQVKLESVFKDAYIDRYRRLGYTLIGDTESTEGGVPYSVLMFSRDRSMPGYDSLVRLEAEVDALCIKAKEASGAPDACRSKRKAVLLSLLCAGFVLMAAGMALVVSGLLVTHLYLAIGGWVGAVAGAALVVVWSCLRERWRMRRIDVADDAAHPGFGADIYSRKIEECLKEAEKIAAQAR